MRANRRIKYQHTSHRHRCYILALSEIYIAAAEPIGVDHDATYLHGGLVLLSSSPAYVDSCTRYHSYVIQ